MGPEIVDSMKPPLGKPICGACPNGQARYWQEYTPHKFKYLLVRIESLNSTPTGHPVSHVRLGLISCRSYPCSAGHRPKPNQRHSLTKVGSPGRMKKLHYA